MSGGPAQPATGLHAIAGRWGGVLAATLVAAAVSSAAWVWIPKGPDYRVAWIMVLAAVLAGVGLVPPLRRGLSHPFDRLDRAASRWPLVAAWAVAGGSAALLLTVALLQGRNLQLKWHDELSYAVQAQIFASGHLWMPAHPLGDAFASFYLIVDPVYVSMYFPGTALIHAPGAWLGVPYWVTSLAVAGACAGLLYRVVSRLLSPTAGLLAVVWLLSIPWFRLLGLMASSG